jgi:hypothetical protein
VGGELDHDRAHLGEVVVRQGGEQVDGPVGAVGLGETEDLGEAEIGHCLGRAVCNEGAVQQDAVARPVRGGAEHAAAPIGQQVRGIVSGGGNPILASTGIRGPPQIHHGAAAARGEQEATSVQPDGRPDRRLEGDGVAQLVAELTADAS